MLLRERACLSCVVVVLASVLFPAPALAEGREVPPPLKRFERWETQLRKVHFEWNFAFAYRDTKKIWGIGRVNFDRYDERRKKVTVWRRYEKPSLPLPKDVADKEWWRDLKATIVEDPLKASPSLWWFDGRRHTLFRDTESGPAGTRLAKVSHGFTSPRFLAGPYYRTRELDWAKFAVSKKMSAWEVTSVDGSNVVVLATGPKAEKCTVLVSREDDHPPHIVVDLVLRDETVSLLVERLPRTNVVKDMKSLGAAERTVEVLSWMKDVPTSLPPIPRLVRAEQNYQVSAVEGARSIRSGIQLWSITAARVPSPAQALEEGPIPSEFKGKTVDVLDQLHRRRLRYNPDGSHDVVGSIGEGVRKSVPIKRKGVLGGPGLVAWSSAIGLLLALLILAVRAYKRRAPQDVGCMSAG